METNSSLIDLFYTLNYAKRDESPTVLDTSCLVKGLDVLACGIGGKKKENLQETILSSITRTTPNPIYYRSLLTIPPNISYDREFKDTISSRVDRFLCYATQPLTWRDLNEVNINVRKRLKTWWGINPKIYDNLYHKFSPIELKYESLLGGGYESCWMYPFDLTNDATIMSRTEQITPLKSYYNVDLRCLFLDIPFKNDYSMFVIIPPETYATKTNLLDFLYSNISGREIDDFYNKNGKIIKYLKVFFPKFTIRSQCHLDGTTIYEYDYLQQIFNENSDFFKISTKLNSMTVKLSCNTEFICNEYGIIPQVVNNDNNRYINDKITTFRGEKRYLNINRNFIFAIMNNKKHINGMGMFINNLENINGDHLSLFDTLTVN